MQNGSIENFRILKEIQSHLTTISSLLQETESQKQRKSKLENSINERKDEQIELNSKLNKIINQINDNEFRLEQLQSRIDKLKNQRSNESEFTIIEKLNSEIEACEMAIQNLEEIILKNLENEEQIRTQLDELAQYFTNIEKTKGEIFQDVEELINIAAKKKDQLMLRLKTLHENLPDDFQSAIQIVKSKGLYQKFDILTSLKENNCGRCGLGITRSEADLIEKDKKLKRCSGCFRIFLPYGS